MRVEGTCQGCSPRERENEKEHVARRARWVL